MEQLVNFAFKHFIFIGLFWGCYRLVISGNTFHQTNRIVILLILIGGCILPWVKLPINGLGFINQNLSEPILYLPIVSQATTSVSEVQSSLNWQEIAFWIYILGVISLLIRYGIALISLLNIIRKSQKVFFSENIWVRVSVKNISPFSWFGYVVLSQKDFKNSPQNILLHEIAHVKQKHSLDMLFCQLYCIVFWWNPWVWLFKDALETVHEFQADAMALKEIQNPKAYCKELITRCVGSSKVALAHRFKTSNLKKRIDMTMKKQSAARAKWNYAFLLLATTASLFLFSAETLQAQETKAKNDSSKGTSEVKTTETKTFVIKDPVIKPAYKEPLKIVDGKEVTNSELNALSPENIQNISILKDEKAIEIYGEKAKFGAIIVTTKMKNAPKSENKQNISTITDSSMSVDETLVIMDGKVISYKELQAYDPNKILLVEVLKDQKSLEKYGAKDKKGVVLVTTKK